MASSAYRVVPQRSNGHYKHRLSVSKDLPIYSSTVQKSSRRRDPYSPNWFISIPISLPGLRTRRLRLLILNPRRLQHYSVSHIGWKRGFSILCVTCAALVLTIFGLVKTFGAKPFIGDSPTLIFEQEDLQRIWEWEVASGHYPSSRKIPEQLRLKHVLDNPALPLQRPSVPSPLRPPPSLFATTTYGVGAQRTYLDIQRKRPDVAYPPRPMSGSIADLDIVMQHCDFSEKKFVRDCLEFLRVGAGLDNGITLRRSNTIDWRYIYLEQTEPSNSMQPDALRGVGRNIIARSYPEAHPERQATNQRQEIPPLALPPPVQHHALSPDACDSENPRIFHMFWAGPFTDKPYLALLSFLYTQRNGLHLHDYPDSYPCRPKFWLWINPGPAAEVPNPSATQDMFDELKSNPWASPFLHPRFKDIIHFKLWNTTEQLDGVPELKDHWRTRDTLFNSGGHSINVPIKKPVSQANKREDSDDILNRTGSKSSSTYDRMSVILSDIARFILCHKYGGIYLDADTIILRDWEEMWGWRGAFAYRWSRLEKYNTAVLHLNKGSALGTFLFKTALKNNLDFHPMTVSRYMKEAHLEEMLLRLPDALFDPAWLNTESYQRERPAHPFFTSFGDFFDTPPPSAAPPQVLGFDAFFKGAYSYHFHNSWWKPFDPSRNWPDLGLRFEAGERIARAAASFSGEENDYRDLSWATVLKRTFEAYIRGESPNMYGEWIEW